MTSLVSEPKIYYVIRFECGHARKTRHKYPPDEIDLWTSTRGYCDQCKKVETITLFKPERTVIA